MSVVIRFPGRDSFRAAQEQVAQAGELARTLGSTWTVAFDLRGEREAPATLHPRKGPPPAQPNHGQVLSFLAAQGRDPFQVTPGFVERVMRDVAARPMTWRGSPAQVANALMLRIAFGLRAAAVERLNTSGGDTPFPPDAASTQRRKAALGYPTDPGRMTGQTAAALAAAFPTIHRG